MRTVSVDLFDAGTAAVAGHLNGMARMVRSTPTEWTFLVQDDVVLYVHLHEYEDYDPDELREVAGAAGRMPSTGVMIDISGRHPGDEEVRKTVLSLLGAFDGRASDDYTSHAWTLDEIRAGGHVQGHPFFDYRGWHTDYERQKANRPDADDSQ